MIKTIIQSIDFSIIKHLFTGFEWNSFLIQPSTWTIPYEEALRE